MTTPQTQSLTSILTSKEYMSYQIPMGAIMAFQVHTQDTIPYHSKGWRKTKKVLIFHLFLPRQATNSFQQSHVEDASSPVNLRQARGGWSK